jgi:hypothetical protein
MAVFFEFQDCGIFKYGGNFKFKEGGKFKYGCV